jgi:hypothetical protein
MLQVLIDLANEKEYLTAFKLGENGSLSHGQIITRGTPVGARSQNFRIAHVTYLPHLNMLKAQLQFQVTVDVEMSQRRA